jgi:hypothetical protein
MKEVKKYVVILIVLVAIILLFVYGQASSVTLTWTAPWDPKIDTTATACVEYDLRHTTDSSLLVDDWLSCIRVTIPPPQDSGMTEVVLITGLRDETLHFFAIRARDSTGNWGLTSNLLPVYIEDVTLPTTIVDLREVGP